MVLLLLLLLLMNVFSFSASQVVGICNPCLDGNCPIGLSCNSNNCCIDTSSSPSTPIFSTTTTPTPTTPSSSCKDTAASNLCRFYRLTGRCLQAGFILWLMVHCKSTCGLCTARVVPIG